MVRHEEVRLDLDRQCRLLDQRLIGQADLDAAKAEAASLEARIANQREQVVVAEREINVRRTRPGGHRHPRAGQRRAVSTDAKPGEMISPVSAGGGFTRTGVCTIVDMSSLQIEVDVNESYINGVSPAQRVVHHGRRGGQYPGDLQEPLGFLQPHRRLLPVELAKVLHGCSATSPLCTSSLASGTYQAGIRRSRT